ncbi:MAG: translocation/assembly module TamB domain-containing protein, partial [Prevotella sp.]
MRKAVKIIGIIVAVPVFLFFIIAALFYFPPFQSWAVKRVTSITSEKTGMEITVERVNLSFPLDLSVDGIKVLKPNDTIPQQKDTIADIKCTIVDIQLLPLFMAQVEIDELDIQNIKFNTSDFIPTAHVKGAAKRLSVKSHGINLKKENVVLDNVMLDGADISLRLLEAEQEDTIKSENNWAIALKNLSISNSSILFNTIGDTITVGTDIKKVSADNGHFDLGNGVYELSAADMVLSKLTYDNNLEPHIKGLDTNHIRLSDVALGVDSVHYATPDLFVKVRKVSAKEEAGLELRQANGIVKMDSTAIHLPSFHIATSYSYVHLNMDMD